jgi:alpha-L-rhamnosidase
MLLFAAGTAIDAAGAERPKLEKKKQGKKKGKQASGRIGGSKRGPSARFSRTKIGASGLWRSYVPDHPSPFVYPVSVEVFNTSAGNTIDNPAGLSSPNAGVTTILSTQASGPYEIVDLGRLTGGRIEIGISASSGVPIRLAYSEARRFLGPGGDVSTSSQGRNDDPSARSDVVPGAAGVYTLAGIRGAQRYIRIELAGAGNVQIDYIRVIVNHLRPTAGDYVGYFVSDDDLLNRIWYAGAYTLNVDSYGDPARGNQFAITDGAKHDRLVWLGDLPLEGLAGFYSVRQMRPLWRRTLQMFTCQQEPGGFIPQVSEVNVNCPVPGPANGPPASAKGICSCVTAARLPSYTGWFVVGVADYYRMTADPRVAQWLPVVRRAIRFLRSRIGSRGLFVTLPGEINWHPPDVAHGEDADTNAVWVRALQGAAMLERKLGAPRNGRRNAKLARRLAAAIRAALFDPSVGALRQNTYNPTGNHTQDANVQGVLSGVLRGRAAAGALNWLGGTLQTRFGTATGEFNHDLFMGRYISPFQSGWEVIARFQYYQSGVALNLIRRLWGQIVSGDPGDTLWEKMTVDGGVAPYQGANPDASPISEDARAGETSLAHGWSAGPTAALSAYVLGMRTASPGWKKWLVEPQPGDLEFAQGSVGTPHGRLGVRWERDAGDRKSFRITVRAPRGTTGIVAIPLFGDKHTIARDGRVVWTNGRAVNAEAHRAGGYVRVIEPHAGTHTYAWAAGGKK